MVTIIFYGEIAEKFGSIHKFALRRLKDIFSALEANNIKIRKYLHQSHKSGVYYRVFINDKPLNCTYELDKILLMNSNIKIIPIPFGQGGILGGSGTGKGIDILSIGIGAIFAIGGIATGQLPLVFAGITLLAGGIIGLLSPQPKFQPEQPKPQSFLFDGVLNTAREGLPVPVVYGRLLVQAITVNSIISTIDTDGTGTGYDACGQAGNSNYNAYN